LSARGRARKGTTVFAYVNILTVTFKLEAAYLELKKKRCRELIH